MSHRVRLSAVRAGDRAVRQKLRRLVDLTERHNFFALHEDQTEVGIASDLLGSFDGLIGDVFGCNHQVCVRPKSGGESYVGFDVGVIEPERTRLGFASDYCAV